MSLLLSSYLLVLLAAQALCQSNLAVHVPAEHAYLLPRPFNNSFTQPFVETSVPASDAADSISAARNASFISYDPDFDTIIGSNPIVNEIASSNTSFAFEGGIWVPTTNTVWFTSFLSPVPGHLSILDLNTSIVTRPTLTGPAADIPINPNGGYFHEGIVYLTSFGDTTTSPAIVSIDPVTYETVEVINSFYGLPLNGPNDVAIAVSRTTGQQCLFYSDFYFAAEGLEGTWAGAQQLPNAVYRLLPSEKSLTMAISPLDIQTPNGLAVDKDNSVLYVSDGPDSAVFGQPYNKSSGSPGLYKFDLGGDEGCTPINKRLVSIARQGFTNGIKVDDFGRIWAAEYEGVVVRSPNGRVLGVFNALDILRNANITDVATIANFALARNKLIWLGFNKIYSIDLGQEVKTWY